MDYTTIIVQALISFATIFGGAGFWSWLSQKKAKKNDIVTDIKEIKDFLEQEKKNSKKQNFEIEAIIESLTALMRERLLDNAHKCIAKGYYTEQEREVYHAIFSIYEKEPFNGDGVIHQLQPILVELPMKDPNGK